MNSTHSIRIQTILGFMMIVGVAAHKTFAQPATYVASATVEVAFASASISTLEFSSVARGVTKSVKLTDTRAARFFLQSRPDKEFVVKFILPATLRNGNEYMPISFSMFDAAQGAELYNPRQAEHFNPHNEIIASLPGEQNGGTLYIWLGGTVSPSPHQAGGEYRGEIMLIASSASN